jgi:hypothetical protein
MPCSRHRLDADGDLAHPEIDRRCAMGLGEAEERIGHEVLRVSGHQIAGESPEEFELLALVAGNGLDCIAALQVSGINRPFLVPPPWCNDETVAAGLKYWRAGPSRRGSCGMIRAGNGATCRRASYIHRG